MFQRAVRLVEAYVTQLLQLITWGRTPPELAELAFADLTRFTVAWGAFVYIVGPARAFYVNPASSGEEALGKWLADTMLSLASGSKYMPSDWLAEDKHVWHQVPHKELLQQLAVAGLLIMRDYKSMTRPDGETVPSEALVLITTLFATGDIAANLRYIYESVPDARAWLRTGLSPNKALAERLDHISRG